MLRRLVTIDSVNPSLVPGARGEKEAAEFVRAWLSERGVAAELRNAAQGGMERPNVVATIGPKSEQPAALLIVAHLDTVGAGDMPEPFIPREQDGRLSGRGALDIKSGVAAMCAAAAGVVREGVRLKRAVLIAGVVDEECDSIGTESLLRECTADQAIVLEPTALQIIVAHKGYAWFEITTRGRAAHGSMPAEGRDAICHMGRVLVALEALEKRLAAAPPHPLLGHASLHASLIEGGQELSSYPAECRLRLERRTLPGESDAALEREIGALLEKLHADDADFRAGLRRISSRPAFSIAREHPIARAACDAVRSVTGAAEISAMPVWTDAALLAAAGIPGVVLGPRGRGLHGAEEYVELDSVVQLAEVLRELVLRLCA